MITKKNTRYQVSVIINKVRKYSFDSIRTINKAFRIGNKFRIKYPLATIIIDRTTTNKVTRDISKAWQNKASM